jgi:hypothetical protein
VIATACLRTDEAPCALRALCARFAALPANESGAVRAEIDLGCATCTMRADASHLALLLEAADPEALARAQSVVVRQLATHASPHGVALAWSRAPLWTADAPSENGGSAA